MPAALDQVFKAYDVRGVYPDQLDEELAERVGRAFVALTGARTLAIGQDMRASSKPMADAVAGYIRTLRNGAVPVVGHSMGGLVSLMLVPILFLYGMVFFKLTMKRFRETDEAEVTS